MPGVNVHVLAVRAVVSRGLYYYLAPSELVIKNNSLLCIELILHGAHCIATRSRVTDA